MWLLPLASGFGCGCFAGSLKLSGPIGSLAVAATGGFAVWLLSFYLLPKIPDPAPPPVVTPTANSAEELKRLLGDRYAEMRKILDTEADKVPDKAAFAQLRSKIEAYLQSLENALDRGDMTRVHDTTKNLLALINSDDTKKILRPEVIPEMSARCSNDDIFSRASLRSL